MATRTLCTVPAFVAMALAVIGAENLEAKDQGLERFLWENRLVLSFAEDGSGENNARQRAERDAARSAWAERDLLLIEISAGTVRIDGMTAPRIDAAVLRNRYDVPAGRFTAILIGKDGGSKLRSRAPLTNPVLFGAIDSMPMRQNEMRRP
ncbi:DUF4174 domain-containing protein [Nisaea sp.]|uniref:DUF4174 domain-containing protein n=1 Tax=Nisaea sp. TaxID=2024842 RepID=UPI003B52FD69